MKLKTTLALLVLAFTLTQCKKETQSKDLTSGIVGKYVNTTENYDIIVNKVDESTVSISITSGYGSSYTSTKMNTATSFTLNTYTSSPFGSQETYSGTGTYSGNNISISEKVVYQGGGENNYVYTGTK